MSKVEWKNLGDICDIKGRIGFRGYTRDDQVEKGKGAISLSPGNIDGGSLNLESCTYITWEKYEESPEIMAFDGDIILGKTASVGKVAMIKDLPEKATINPQLVLLKEISINSRYLYYVLSDTPFQMAIKKLAGIGSVPNVSQAKLALITIPVPSEKEQERIVNVLDTFTSSIENLKEQIGLRRKQYEYYRDQLLDLEGKEGVEMRKLSETCEIRRGIRVVKKQLKDTALYPVFQNSIAPMGYYDQYNRDGNMPYVICAGSSSGSVGYCFTPFWAADDCYTIESSNLNRKYIYYALKKNNNKLFKLVRKGSMPRLPHDAIDNLIIPIPPFIEQQRIVDILDTFEASIQNLEAQLTQREKQYEYYRNKLLTFE